MGGEGALRKGARERGGRGFARWVHYLNAPLTRHAREEEQRQGGVGVGK